MPSRAGRETGYDSGGRPLVTRIRAVLAVSLVVALAAAGVWLVGGDFGGARAPDHGPVAERPADRSSRRAGDVVAPAANGDAAWIARHGAGTIIGRVVRGVPERPIAARVTVTRAVIATDDPGRSAETDAQGVFRIDGAPADAPLRVVATASGCVDAVLDSVRVARDGVRDVGDLLVGAPATLRLTLTDDGGSPVSARVGVHPPKARYLRLGPREGDGSSGAALSRSAPTGVCEISPMPLRSLLTIRADGFLPVARSLELRDGETRDLSLRLRRGVAFGGRVVTWTGAAVPGVRVRLAGLSSYSPEVSDDALTDAQGRFTLTTVPQGPVRLACVLDDCCSVPLGRAQVPEADGATLRLPPLGALEGRVVDAATGGGVPGAQVIRGGATAETAGDGSFRMPRVPVGTASVTCEAEGFASVVVAHDDERCPDVVADATTSVRVELKRGAAIAGSVRGPDGAPVAGALVEVLAWRASEGLRLAAAARTGAGGEFRADAIPEGMALVRIQARGLAMEGYPADPHSVFEEAAVPSAWAVTVPASGLVEREFALSRGAVVTGIVVDADDAPVAGALVTAGAEYGEQVFALTGADGAFRVEAVPPVVECRVACSTADGRTGELPEFPVETGATVSGLRLVAMPAVVRVEGLVIRGGEDPVPAGTTVVLGAGDGEDDVCTETSVAVTADGRFSGTVPAHGGRVRVVARAAGMCETMWRSTGDEVPGDTVRPTLLLHAATPIEGVVVDEDGAAVADASIRVVPSNNDWDTESRVVMAISDASGRFLLREGPGAAATLWADASGHAAARVRVAPGAATLRIVLSRTLSIDGRVTSAETGAPLAGVVVNVAFGSSLWRRGGTVARTGADGRWRVDGLESGRHTVWAAPRYVAGQPNVVEDCKFGVVAGATGVDFALPRGLAVAGRVVDEEGRLFLGNASVEVFAEGDELPETVNVRDDGTFEIRGLLPGRVSLAASTWFADLVGERAEDVECGRTDVLLRLRRGAEVVARFVDERGGIVVVDPDGAELEETGWRFATVFRAPDTTPGSVRWTKLRPATDHTLRVRAVPGFLPVRMNGIRTGAPGETVEITVRLVRAGRITGRVVDAAGAPLVGVEVVARAESVDSEDTPGAAAGVVTGDDGSFVLDGLGPHRFALRVRPRGGGAPFGPEPAPVHGLGDEVELRVEKPR